MAKLYMTNTWPIVSRPPTSFVAVYEIKDDPYRKIWSDSLSGTSIVQYRALLREIQILLPEHALTQVYSNREFEFVAQLYIGHYTMVMVVGGYIVRMERVDGFKYERTPLMAELIMLREAAVHAPGYPE